MTRITSAFWLLVAGALFDQAAVAGVRYFDISGSTATAENACPAWVPANNQDDCSYNASDPSTAGTEQWIGPVFGAGYYAPGEIDDLKRIRGIGVLIEKKLNSLGITSYEQVANWTSADIARISQMLDFVGRIERENWVEQARILASGGQTEFSRRADRGEV